MTTITELKKLLFSMILKTPIWLVHLAANQSSVMSIPTSNYTRYLDGRKVGHFLITIQKSFKLIIN